MASSPLYTQWQQLKFNKVAAPADDDDCSTAVPSDVMGATASDISSWDAGNLEDLSSCGVLSSAEMRAARLQKLAKASATQPKSRSTAGVAKAKAGASPKAKVMPMAPKACRTAGVSATLAKAKAGALLTAKAVPTAPPAPKPQAALSQSTGSQGYSATPQPNAGCATGAENKDDHDDDQSTATPDSSASLQDLESIVGLSSTQLRAARRQMTANTGTQIKSELDKSSREAIREMGLWEYMPARNPVVTRTSKKGADWNVGFEEYQHSLGGVPDAKPIERPHEADELVRRLDLESREAIKEMGLWEHMPAKNPVVTRQSKKGAAWHVGFDEYEQSLGGVPDSKPVERPHAADELCRHFDVQSRGSIKEIGLWEHMPARNPVVTSESRKGADWHVGFEDYVHTLGGVPDSKPIEMPHRADVMNRHLDKSSCEAVKKMGHKQLWGQMGR